MDDYEEGGQPTTGVGGWFKKNSTVLAIVVGGVLLGVVFLKKPANADSSGTTPPTGDWSGVEVDPYGNRVIYRDTGSQFINVSVENPTQPTASAPVTVNVDNSAPVEHPIENTPSRTSTGLLGPNALIDFARRTYTSPTVHTPTPLPIPANDPLVQGSQNRVWYIDNGLQKLLTSGTGPPVTNDGFPVGSPQNSLGAYQNSSSTGSTTNYNTSYQSTVNTH